MHNRGVGVVNTTGVIQVRINLLKPDASAMHIALPSLYVRLDPETHVIIYRTIDMIATPAIRSAIETIGNDRVNKKLVACMRDPAWTCSQRQRGLVIPRCCWPLRTIS